MASLCLVPLLRRRHRRPGAWPRRQPRRRRAGAAGRAQVPDQAGAGDRRSPAARLPGAARGRTPPRHPRRLSPGPGRGLRHGRGAAALRHRRGHGALRLPRRRRGRGDDGHGDGRARPAHPGPGVRPGHRLPADQHRPRRGRGRPGRAALPARRLAVRRRGRSHAGRGGGAGEPRGGGACVGAAAGGGRRLLSLGPRGHRAAAPALGLGHRGGARHLSGDRPHRRAARPARVGPAGRRLDGAQAAPSTPCGWSPAPCPSLRWRRWTSPPASWAGPWPRPC